MTINGQIAVTHIVSSANINEDLLVFVCFRFQTKS